MNIYEGIIQNFEKGEKNIAALLDPDTEDISNLNEKLKLFERSNIDYVFVGGSTSGKNDFNEFTEEVKNNTKLPVIIFPGSSSQISSHADAMLFLSLVSGKNPQYLIGEHINAAPILKKTNLEVIPTGYILVDGGNTTTVEFISGTKPVPQDKPDIAKKIAYAAELLGMRLIYMDCGSGAMKSINNTLIEEVKNYINIPLIVGGGIRTTEEIWEKHRAGADIVVIGSALEDEPELLFAG